MARLAVRTLLLDKANVPAAVLQELPLVRFVSVLVPALLIAIAVLLALILVRLPH